MRFLRLFSIFIVLFPISVFAQDVWTLERCLLHAEQQNLTLNALQVNSELNILRKKNFYKKVLPEFSSGVSHGYNWGQAIDPFTNEFALDRIRTDNLILSGDLVIFEGLKKLNEFKYLKSQLVIDSLNLSIEKDKLKMKVCKQYLSSLVKRKEVLFMETKLQKRVNDKIQAERLLKSGKISQFDYIDIALLLDQDSLKFHKTKGQYIIEKTKLKAILNINQNVKIILTDLPETIGEKNDSIRITSSNSIQLLKEKKKALGVKEKIINSSFSPVFSVSTSIGSGYSGNSKELSGTELKTKAFETQIDDNFYQSVIFSLNIPLSSSLSAYHNKQELKIEKRILDFKEKEAINQFITEVLILKKEIEFLESRALSIEKNIVVANQHEKNGQLRFKLGNIDYSDFSRIQDKTYSLNLELEITKANLYIKKFLLDLLE